MMEKDKKFQLRLTEKERDRLHMLAKKEGLSAGAWLRAHIKKGQKVMR